MELKGRKEMNSRINYVKQLARNESVRQRLFSQEREMKGRNGKVEMKAFVPRGRKRRLKRNSQERQN